MTKKNIFSILNTIKTTENENFDALIKDIKLNKEPCLNADGEFKTVGLDNQNKKYSLLLKFLPEGLECVKSYSSRKGGKKSANEYFLGVYGKDNIQFSATEGSNTTHYIYSSKEKSLLEIMHPAGPVREKKTNVASKKYIESLFNK